MEIQVGSSVIRSSYAAKVTKKQLRKIRRIRRSFYTRDKDGMRNALHKVLLNNGVTIGPIYEYFFARVANDAKRYDKKASINEALASDMYLAAVLNHIKAKPDFYRAGNLVGNVKQSFRTGGIGGVKKLANFPLKPVLALAQKYAPPPISIEYM